MRHEELREKVIERKPVYDGILLKMEHIMVELPTGKQAAREIAHHVGAVAVVPVDEMGYTTMVWQYRPAIGRTTLEIPAGKLDAPGEDPEDAARRELKEELGITAQNLTKLTQIVPSPGYLTERITLYLATGLSQGETHFDEDEFLAAERLPLSEAVARVMGGEIEDAKSICGLMMAYRHLQG